MGHLAVYIAIEGEQLDELWALDDAVFRESFLDVEADESLARLSIDKIWDALHCTLTGRSAGDPVEDDPLSEAIVGVHPRIYEGDDYSVYVSVIDNDEQDGIIAAVNEVGRAGLESKLDPKRMEQERVYPNGIWTGPPEQLVDEMHTTLRDISTFFNQAKVSGLHVLATFL